MDLRFPGYEDVEIVNGVPKGWHMGMLGEIVVFQRGKTITRAQVKEGNVPVVAGGIEPAYYHNEANTKYPVITVSGSGANAGFSRMYHEDVFASDCSFADIQRTKCITYVYCFLKANKYQLDALQKGSAQPHAAGHVGAARRVQRWLPGCKDCYPCGRRHEVSRLSCYTIP